MSALEGHISLSEPRADVSTQVRAAVLAEAIHFMRRFARKVVVVKYGGNVLAGGDGNEFGALSLFAEDIVLMHAVGMLPVVVHGGGPQIGEMMARLGKTPEFRDGLRVTDAETLDIVRMVLVGKVNREIVRALNVFGPLGVGLSGEDARLITAALRDPRLGFVGDVVSIDTSMLTRLCDEGLIPVIATIGADAAGQAYNINADTVAGEIAQALGAEKLVLLTDVEGVRSNRDDAHTLVSELRAAELEGLIADGTVAEGMIPKARACIDAVRGGVESAHILDGRVPHALLVELLSEEGVGTMVIAK